MRASQTPPELALWEAAAKFRKHVRMNRQQVIRGFIADFYLPELRAVVEVDGDYHLEPEQIRKDARREGLFHDWNYSVLRLRAQLVMRDAPMCVEVLESFVDDLTDAKRSRGSLTTIPTWTFTEYGLLTRRDWYTHKWETRHWFRVTPDLPDCVVINFGSGVGEVEAHDYEDCDESLCADWVVE